MQTASADAPAGTDARAAVATAGLRKVYGRHVALHDLSLTVHPGEVFGFLGPNGAGKTTTVKILTGLVRPTAGEARIFGRPVGDPAARRHIGYLPEHFRFHDWMTGVQLLEFHGRLAGLSPQQRRTRIPEVLEQVGLAGRGDERMRGYSKGMSQRIGLAQALVSGPDLVLLDEPTSALDPIGRRDIRDLIRCLRDAGTAVLLNSHLLSEVELVCDRVAVVDHGRVVRSGRLDELVGPAVHIRLEVDRVDEGLLAALAGHGRATVTGRPVGGGVAAGPASEVTLAVADVRVAPAVAEAVVRSGYRLFALVPVQRSLEDVFVDLVRGSQP